MTVAKEIEPVDTLAKLGKASEFVEGLRVTDEETVGVVEMVLAGSTNKGIVRLINQHGGKAVGLSGSDAGLTSATKLTLSRTGDDGAETQFDLGQVGEVIVRGWDIFQKKEIVGKADKGKLSKGCGSKQ